MPDSDSDWLEAPHQGGAQDPLVEAEWSRLATKYSDAGYREGITDGKLATLQQGFDESFAKSVPNSRRLGKLRGRANGLLAFALSLQQASPPPLASPAAVNGISTSPSRVPKTPGQPSHAIQNLVDEIRDLVRDLGLVKRDTILPRDREREEHERDEHGAHGQDEDVFELDPTEKRQMESIENMLEGMNGTTEMQNGGIAQKREEELLGALEDRLVDVEKRLRGIGLRG